MVLVARAGPKAGAEVSVAKGGQAWSGREKSGGQGTAGAFRSASEAAGPEGVNRVNIVNRQRPFPSLTSTWSRKKEEWSPLRAKSK